MLQLFVVLRLLYDRYKQQYLVFGLQRIYGFLILLWLLLSSFFLYFCSGSGKFVFGFILRMKMLFEYELYIIYSLLFLLKKVCGFIIFGCLVVLYGVLLLFVFFMFDFKKMFLFLYGFLMLLVMVMFKVDFGELLWQVLQYMQYLLFVNCVMLVVYRVLDCVYLKVFFNFLQIFGIRGLLLFMLVVSCCYCMRLFVFVEVK